MERLVRDLRSVADRKCVSPLYKRVVVLLADGFERLRGENFNAAERVASAMDATAVSRLKFFKPIEQRAIVDKWNELWRRIEPELGETLVDIALTNVIRDTVLKLLCYARSVVEQVSDQTPLALSANSARETAAIPTALQNRYVRQAAFTVIRAKQWLKRNRNERSSAAISLLNTLAPNKRIGDGSGEYAHVINDAILHIVRLVDARCRTFFNPAHYGANALKMVIEEVPKDVVLLSEIHGVLEMALTANCSVEVVRRLLEAVVHGAGSSIGRHLLQADKAQRTKPPLSVALRTGFKVTSANSKR